MSEASSGSGSSRAPAGGAAGERAGGLRAAFYGDDFTGSVDALLQFARRGWTGRLFVGLPDEDALAEAASAVDVIGIAGIARSLPTADLDDELRPVFTKLAGLRPHLLQYKACSTADSSPDIGSLGRVIELGREIVTDATVPVLFAQPDFGRYTAFGTHFAAEGGIVHRLDRQPTMSRHPSTPMTEADLAVHLGRQTSLAVGSLAYPSYTSPDSVAAALTHSAAAAVVLDALDDAHLTVVGAALLSLPAPVFAIGSGGLSHGVAAADPGSVSARADAAVAASTGTTGPVLVVSGSRSAQTRRQANAAAAAGWLVRPLDLGGVADAPRGAAPQSRSAVAGGDDARFAAGERRAGAGTGTGAGAGTTAAAEVLGALAAGRSVVLTSDDADTSGLEGEALLETIARAAASVVRAALDAGATRRVIVCGGDTSSRITRLLDVGSLSIAANPWDNVVLLRAHAADPLIDGVDLLLKGGQVGSVDLFERIRTLA